MNNRMIYLSHFLGISTPLFGGINNISILHEKSIKNGDSCNTLKLSFSNHSGTHIDAPSHFIDNGKTITDYSPEFWLFNYPSLIVKKAEKDEIIDLTKEIESLSPETDLLLLKTSFGDYRELDDYWKSNPGIMPANASLLRQRCPNLKAIGFDFISITGYNNRPIGREAHKEFLKNDILIIEDMNLNTLNENPKRIIGLPILLENADGAPITIIAELK